MSELLPCPFCGKVPTMSYFEFGGAPFCEVRCCVVKTGSRWPESVAAELWNRRTPQPVTPAGGEVVPDALVYAVLDAFNEAAGDGELFLTSLRDAMRMRLALTEALKANPPVADAARKDDAQAD